MNTHNKHIKNRDAYFKKVFKNMKLKENIKQAEIEDSEIFVDAPFLCSNFLDNFDLDKALTDRNLLGWIDMIENQKLHAAIKNLSLYEQILLRYIFEKNKTQCDLEKIYKIKHQSICEKVNKIIDKLKSNL